MNSKAYDQLSSRKFILIIGIVLVFGLSIVLILRQTTDKFHKIHNSSFEKVIAVEELSVITLEIQNLIVEDRNVNSFESLEKSKSLIAVYKKEIQTSLDIIKSNSVNLDAVEEIANLYTLWLLSWEESLALGTNEQNIEKNLIDLAVINAKIGILEELQYSASNEAYHNLLKQINDGIMGLIILVGLVSLSLIAVGIKIKRETNSFIEEIRDKQLLYDMVVSTMPDSLILIDNETGQIIEANPAAENIYQFTQDELKQMKNTDLSAEPEKTRAAVNGTVTAIPLRWHKRKNGEIFPVEIKASRFKWKGRNVHLAWIEDISNRMETEKNLIDAKIDAEKGERVKNAFLSNMTHEIRTPLNGLQGALQLIEGMSVNQEQDQLIKIGIESSQSLLSLLDNILDYSQMTSGKLFLENRPFSIVKEVNELVGAFETLAITKGIELKTNIEEKRFSLYTGDRLRVRQIMMNLISNAVKFTTNGQVNIFLEILYEDHKMGKGVRIRVEDTGCGIEDEDLLKIFDQFSQLDSSLTKAHPGAGLGLAIVKELVKQMDGKIEVKSIINEGTVFTVTLPLMPYTRLGENGIG
jgi:PAS domain S-box-containing protein